jgi:hypothetical protein
MSKKEENLKPLNKNSRRKIEGDMNNNLPGQQKRFLMSKLACFMTRVREAEMLGGEHPYGYAFDNPATYIDPLGLEPMTLMTPGLFTVGTCPPGAKDCCCCPKNGALKHYRLRGTDPGYPPETTWPKNVNDQWRGHIVVFNVTLHWFIKKGSGGGGCTLDISEALKVNGKPFKGKPFAGSTMEKDWKGCLKQQPPSCRGDVNCAITDFPGATNIDRALHVGKLDWKLRVTAAFKGGARCDCDKMPPLVFDQHVKWNSARLGDPDVWLPKDN